MFAAPTELVISSVPNRTYEIGDGDVVVGGARTSRSSAPLLR